MDAPPFTPTVGQLPTSPIPPTEMIALETPTNTPEPLPTPTQGPFLPDGLMLLSYATLSQVEQLAAIPLSGVTGLEFSPDGLVIMAKMDTAEGDQKVIFIDLKTGEEVFRLDGDQRIYFNPDNTTVAALYGKSLTVYDLKTGEKKIQYNSRNLVAALSPDGRTLVEFEDSDTETGTTLRVVDLTADEEKYRIFVNGELDRERLHFDGDSKRMAATYFVPPGTYVSTIWKADSGGVLYTEYGYSEILLHPFGSEVAASSANKSYISLISSVTWVQKHYLGSAGEDPGYYDLGYASGGRLIYALSDGEKTGASFWYPPTGERIDLDLDLDLLAVSISPNRRLMATSDRSGSVILWGVPE